MSEVYINDVDLADYGFVLGQLGDVATTERASALVNSHASAPGLSDPLGALPGLFGAAWLAEPVVAAARVLIIGGYVLGASPADFLAKVDQLKGLVSQGAVRLRLTDRPTQEYRDGRLLSFSANPRGALLASAGGDVSFSLQIADPLRYDVNPQGIALSVSRASLPVGTAPSFPLIVLHGNGATLTNPALAYRNASGEVQQSMSFTGSLGATDYLVVDCVRTQVTRITAGVASDGLAWWAAGDFPAVRPFDGWVELGAYPTLELTASAGVPFGVITYARAWL